MLISILAILIPLIWGPIETSGSYRSAIRWERAQIAVDNAAIVLGRSDREVFNRLSETNRWLRKLELLHHPLHACARTVGATARCISQDRALEAQIRFLHESAYQRALQSWHKGTLDAASELRKLNTRLGAWDRRMAPPLRSGRCPVCGMETSWEIDDKKRPLRTHLRAEAPQGVSVTLRFWGKNLRGDERWNFSLEPLVITEGHLVSD